MRISTEIDYVIPTFDRAGAQVTITLTSAAFGTYNEETMLWEWQGDIAATLGGAGTLQGDALGDRFIDIQNLFGSNFDDGLAGSFAHNFLNGGVGDDDLYGIGVNDLLMGGVAADTIALKNAAFTQFGAAEPLSAAAFHIGASASAAAHRVIYNAATGAFSYDADGQGGTAAVRFAAVFPGLAMTSADFVVI